MNYEPYADIDYYCGVFNGDILKDGDILKYLKQASRHIDSLTYNRIVSRGISNLTPYQQEIIQEVVCEQAEFEYQNQEVFNSVLSGYSINGVSMSFGESWNVTIQKGIPIRRDLYERLGQTGLTCRLLR